MKCLRAVAVAAVAVVGLASGAAAAAAGGAGASAGAAVASGAASVAGAQPATDQITLHIQPGAGYRPITQFIRSAKETLDYNIYQFNDRTIENELIAAQKRGVKVRVMFTWQVFAAGSNQ